MTQRAILIIDNDNVFINGLATMLDVYNIGKITTKTCPQQALALLQTTRFDLLIVDLKMPRMSGVDLLQVLFERKIQIPSMIISAEFYPYTIRRALHYGCHGFVLKGSSPENYTKAINTILQGGRYFLKEHAQQINHECNLTERQIKVLNLIHQGYQNKEISKALNISPETVKGHVHAIYLTLNVNNRVSCVIKAIELGLQPSPFEGDL